MHPSSKSCCEKAEACLRLALQPMIIVSGSIKRMRMRAALRGTLPTLPWRGRVASHERSEWEGGVG